MSRTFNVYKAAHLLPDGPYTEAEIAELLQAMFFILRALPGEYQADHGEIYSKAWDRVNDNRSAAE